MKKEFKKTGEIKIVVYKELDKKSPVFNFRTNSPKLIPLVNILEDTLKSYWFFRIYKNGNKAYIIKIHVSLFKDNISCCIGKILIH